MSFVVSARKYRPNRFEDVVGQAHVAQTLKNALRNDKLAHAFLFCGPRGVGKTTCARILAKVINCQNSADTFEPCNTCDSCKAFNENASFNIIELDAASNNSVEHIRQLIEQVRFQPQQGRYKVFIIDEVHMLSAQAFNAFLKTLEEPPPYAVFILATTEKHKILPTILSRCQIFDFKRIQIAEMVSHLQNICRREGIEADENALHIIAQKADGALRDALSIFDRIVSFSGKSLTYQDVISNLNILDYDYFFRFTEALLTENLPEVMLIFDEVLRNGFEADTFINELAEHFRNLLICKDEQTLALLEVGENLKDQYRRQAQLAPASFLLSALNIANDCDVNFKMARNKRLHAEMALIKMTYLGRAIRRPAAPPPAPEKKTADANDRPVKPPPPQKTENKTEASAPQKRVEEPAPAKNIEWNPAATETPKLKGLEMLMAEVAAESGDAAENEQKELTLEMAVAAWTKYTDTKDNHLKEVLQNTELALEGEKLIAVVGSTLAENTLMKDLDLMDFLRQELKSPELIREIRIDESKASANKAPKAPKPLTPREKYQKMLEINPLVKEVFDRFDLQLEE